MTMNNPFNNTQGQRGSEISPQNFTENQNEFDFVTMEPTSLRPRSRSLTSSNTVNIPDLSGKQYLSIAGIGSVAFVLAWLHPLISLETQAGLFFWLVVGAAGALSCLYGIIGYWATHY